MRLFGFFSTATVAVALLVSACGGSDNEPTTSTAGTGAGTGTGTGTVGQGGQGATGTGTGTGTATGVGGSPPVGPLGDNFDGSGPLVDYVTNNPSALPDVGRVDGRYRANLDDNENDIALDGDARPGDRVLYHFEHLVFGGIINSNGKKIDWDDGDNWTIVKRPKSMQLTKKPLTAMKYGQWAIVRRASSADEPRERASKRPRRAPAAAI